MTSENNTPDSTSAPSEATRPAPPTPPPVAESLVREQKRELIIRRWLDGTKVLIAAIGAIIVFLYLQKPDSIVNRSVSAESIARERAKLLLEVVREQDPMVRSLSVKILAAAYPKNDPLSRELFEILRLREQLVELQQSSGELAKLLSEVQAAPSDVSTSVYRNVRDEALNTTNQLRRTNDALAAHGVAVPPPMRCITLAARNLTSYSATLAGASVGTKTRDWFDFDATPQLRFSVAAEKGIGLAKYLQPKSTYYFRYVVQSADGTCFGEVKAFTTPAL